MDKKNLKKLKQVKDRLFDPVYIDYDERKDLADILHKIWEDEQGIVLKVYKV